MSRVQSGPLGVLLDDIRDRAIRKARGLHMAAPADRAKDRPVVDFCGVQPGSERHYGTRYFTGDDGDHSATTFLVGLGLADGDTQALGHFLNHPYIVRRLILNDRATLSGLSPACKGYGQMALRTCFLLNGGAIIALLTFIGSLAGKHIGSTEVAPAFFVKAFSMFAGGLVCTAASMAFACFNYMLHHDARAEPGALANNMISPQPTWPGNFSSTNARLVNWSWKLAVVLGFASIGFFGTGCYAVAAVFSALK